MNHIILIVLDSCRYDSLIESRSRFLLSLPSKPELRYSYASWTAPSHYNMMMGLMPHTSPINTYASELYTKEFSLWGHRIGISNIDIKKFLPSLWLPHLLKKLGYITHARVSMPVLNPSTPLNVGFTDYKLVQNHNSLGEILGQIELGKDPEFWLVNTGETHYPYMLDDSSLPIVSGLHGAVRKHDENFEHAPVSDFFTDEVFATLHQAQRRAVRYVDRLISDFTKRCPPNTHIIITSDHGELFGEDGFFGHGPIFHRKVHEVPFQEFRSSDVSTICQ